MKTWFEFTVGGGKCFGQGKEKLGIVTIDPDPDPTISISLITPTNTHH
jgi:hypothetical protein